MLQWKEVSYALNGMECTVIFDTAKHPRDFRKYTGRIDVADRTDAMPILKNPFNDHIMMPPWYAIVIIHTPDPLDTNHW